VNWTPVVYICSVIGLTKCRREGALAARALVSAALVLALGLAGCGSNGGEGSTEKSSADATPPAEAQAPKSSTTDKTGSAAGGSQQAEHTQKGGRSEAPRRASHGQDSQAVAGENLPGAAASACPAGSRAQCKALAEAESKVRHSHSYEMAKPRDCLQVMSRAECEAIIDSGGTDGRQISAAAVRECLRHPNPHCEEQLKPILEAQYAAVQAAGK